MTRVPRCWIAAALIVASGCDAEHGRLERERIEAGTDRQAPAGEDLAFSATGNEPGWRLELDARTVTLSADYGALQLSAATPQSEHSAGARVWRTTAHGPDGARFLVVRLEERLCRDSMTGMPYPLAVAVDIDRRSLTGCGGERRELLRGREWIIEDVDGRGIVENSRPTIAFMADGEFGGHGSCNHYGGEYRLTGEGITTAEISSTLMACAEPLMEQERLVLGILQGLIRFDIDDDGALVLHAGDGRSLTARRFEQPDPG